MTPNKFRLITYCLACFIFATAFVVYLSVPAPVDAIAAGGGPSVTTVASGLHNPRGLNFGPDGALYVAEAAADGPHGLTHCGVMGDGQRRCYAETGSITRIDLKEGTQERIIEGLPSLISADPAPTATPLPNNGNGGTGIHDISFQGLGNGYFTMGLGGNPTLRETYFGEDGLNLDRLGRFNPSGKWSLRQDMGAFEAANNPDGFVPDSNPYGILALPGKTVLTDAGGNDLIQVSANGRVSVLAVFPNRVITRPGGAMVSVQAVPTSVAVGPDGDYYVGQLTGGPFTVGVAFVWRVPERGGTPVAAYTGFTNIIDIAVGEDGSLYVLEIARNAIPNFGQGGRLVHIAPDGTQTDVMSGPPLIAPGGIAIGGDGALYVTNFSTSSTMGQVLRIEQ